MQPGEDVLALVAQGEALAQLRPCEHRARRVDAHRPFRVTGQRAQFVQPQIHLVGDVTEIAPAARGAPVVHLKRGDHTRVVDLDGLGVLTADVKHRPRPSEHGVSAASVTQDLRSDLALGEGETRPAIACAYAGRLLQRDRDHGAHRLRELRGGSLEFFHRLQGVILETAGHFRGVLDFEHRSVEETGEHVEGQVLLGRLLLGQSQIAAPREVPEEVALASGSTAIEARRFLLHSRKQLRGGSLERRASAPLGGKTLDDSAQNPQLSEILLHSDPSLEILEEGCLHLLGQTPRRQLRGYQGETRVDQRLAERHLTGHVVIAAAVGDAAAHHLAVEAHHHRLGGGGAEVDADGALHAAPPGAFFCSSIWK